MAYFDPTPAEMLFRISVSMVGLALLMAALTLRGVPADPAHVAFGAGAIAFLLSSAGLSGLKLRALRAD